LPVWTPHPQCPVCGPGSSFCMGLLVTVSDDGAGCSRGTSFTLARALISYGTRPAEARVLRTPASSWRWLVRPNKAITSAGGGAWYSKPARSCGLVLVSGALQSCADATRADPRPAHPQVHLMSATPRRPRTGQRGPNRETPGSTSSRRCRYLGAGSLLPLIVEPEQWRDLLHLSPAMSMGPP
jgi:hypothetical protein